MEKSHDSAQYNTAGRMIDSAQYNTAGRLTQCSMILRGDSEIFKYISAKTLKKSKYFNPLVSDPGWLE